MSTKTIATLRPESPYPETNSPLLSWMRDLEWHLWGLRHLLVKLEPSGVCLGECDHLIQVVQRAREDIAAVLSEKPHEEKELQ